MGQCECDSPCLVVAPVVEGGEKKLITGHSMADMQHNVVWGGHGRGIVQLQQRYSNTISMGIEELKYGHNICKLCLVWYKHGGDSRKYIEVEYKGEQEKGIVWCRKQMYQQSVIKEQGLY